MKHETIRKAETIPFTWDDPFLLDEQLTEEERLIQQSARGFAQDVLQPRVIDAFREEIDAPELFPMMGEAGLLGATISEEFGGAEASYVAYGLIAREVERVDSGYRSMMSVQSSLVIHPINTYGSDEQRRKYLPLLDDIGMTEPDDTLPPIGLIPTQCSPTGLGPLIF